MRKLIISLLALSCVGLFSAQANMLENPGFEIRGGGEGPWAYTPSGWWSYQASNGVANSEGWGKQPEIGGTNGCWFAGWLNDAYAGLGQDVSVDLADGNVFSFSINLFAEENFTSTGSELWLKLEFWDSAGKVYDTGNQSIYDAAKAASDWSTYTITYTNTDSSIVMVKPMIGYGGAQNQGGDHQAVKFDNAVFLQSTAVPEPVSAALLGAGLGLIYLFRRKIQK